MEPILQNDSNRMKPLLLALVLLPVGVHTLGLVPAVRSNDGFRFGWLDLGLFCLALGYVAIGCLLLPRRATILRFLLAAYSSFFAVVCAEVVLDAKYRLRLGLPHQPMHAVHVAADTMPGIEGEIEFTVNQMGIRGRDVPLEGADVRILCVGGSTTECLYVTDRKSWPWRVEDILTERTAKRIYVGNAGVDGHTSLHHEYLLQNYRWTKDYDWIVVLVGINDLGMFLRDDYEERARLVDQETFAGDGFLRAPTYYRRLRVCELVRSALPMTSDPNRIFQDWTGEWYRDVRRHRQEAIRTGVALSSMPDATTALLNYRNGLKSIIATTRALDIRLILMTQPTMYRPGLPQDLENLLWARSGGTPYATPVLAELMNLYNDILRSTCAEEHVDCIDLAAQLPADTSTFYDDCHFNVSGCESVAQIVASFFVDALE